MWHERITVAILVALLILGWTLGYQHRIDDWNTRRRQRRVLRRWEP